VVLLEWLAVTRQTKLNALEIHVKKFRRNAGHSTITADTVLHHDALTRLQQNAIFINELFATAHTHWFSFRLNISADG
jgi:hypothetical protein